MLARLFLTFLATTFASQLTLSPETSTLKFGANGAILNARCPSVGPQGLEAAASWAFYEPKYSSVRVFLIGVPTSCAGLGLAVPCVSTSAYYPKLFHCAWSRSGTEKVQVSGQAAAMSTELDATGEPTGATQVHLTCPLPAPSDFTTLSGGASQASLKLRVLHTVLFDDSENATTSELGFKGVRGGNLVTASLSDGVVVIDGADASTTPPPTWLTLHSRYPEEGGDLIKVGATAALVVDKVNASDVSAERIFAAAVEAGEFKASSLTVSGAVSAGSISTDGAVSAGSISMNDASITASKTSLAVEAQADIVFSANGKSPSEARPMVRLDDFGNVVRLAPRVAIGPSADDASGSGASTLYANAQYHASGALSLTGEHTAGVRVNAAGLGSSWESWGGGINSKTDSPTLNFQSMNTGRHFAFWRTNGERALHVDVDSGNIGVGTPSPVAKLEVAGAGVFTKGAVYASEGFVRASGPTARSGIWRDFAYVPYDGNLQLLDRAGQTVNSWHNAFFLDLKMDDKAQPEADNTMLYYHLQGYNYGSAQIIDSHYGSHPWQTFTCDSNKRAILNTGPGATLTGYCDPVDNHLVLRLSMEAYHWYIGVSFMGTRPTGRPPKIISMHAFAAAGSTCGSTYAC